MVYCGKPSKSCYPCRQKRTKCDLLLPSCTQCIRTGRICSGYRSQDGLQIRDQSTDVVSKHAAPNDKGTFEFPRTENGFAQNLDLSFQPIPVSHRPTLDCSILKGTIPQSLGPLDDDGPASFFFNEYVVDDSKAPRNLFDLLPAMNKQAPAGSLLSTTFKALGLACLANSLQSPHLMMQANTLYARMLTLTNSALRDPVGAKADQTLISVLLLGLFEEINAASRTIEPWTNHVRGALALLDYRGLNQLERKFSLHAIAMLRMQVVANSLVRRVEVPASILKWSKLAQEREEKDEDLADSDTVEIIAMFCNLQAAIDSPGSTITAAEIVSRASALEIVLQKWAAKWQLRIPFEAINIPKKVPGVFTDHWHSFPSIQVATLWNYYRCIRIQVNQILIKYLPQTETALEMSSDFETQVNICKRIVIDMSHEICASVPFFLNQNGSDGLPPSAYQRKTSARVRLLIWPLYVAGQTDYVSDIMRFWVAEQMENMGNLMGISKAKALVALLRSRQKTSARQWRDLGVNDNLIDLDIPNLREANTIEVPMSG